MNIKQGDIFLRNEQVYVVEQTAGRVVYMAVIGTNGVVIHDDLAYFRTTLERYFTKLTI